MPQVSKKSLSRYLRSECDRQLRLELSPHTKAYAEERKQQDMPSRIMRPGLEALRTAGDEWEKAKVNDLAKTFGIGALKGIHHTLPDGTHVFDDAPLRPLLAAASAGTFLVQPEFPVGLTFQAALQLAALQQAHDLDYARLRPDLIQVLAPQSAARQVLPDGSVIPVPSGDTRLPLRIIDIKLTAEPSVPYFTEVTYYTMALAGGLVDEQQDGAFFVVPEAAIWPGSHETSALIRLQGERAMQGMVPTKSELIAALETDLEEVAFGVFAPRIRSFFQRDLSQILATPWKKLDWHVDSRCLGCDYLGYPWPGVQTTPLHCWRQATARDHLSRVAFVSRGARGALESHQISTVAELASTAAVDPAYDDHQSLRATRTVIAGRAQSLQTGQASVPPQSGTSAVMPRWVDLRIHLTADFDVGSGVTIAFGFRAYFWVKPERVREGSRPVKPWRARSFVIDQRDLATERRELMELLKAIHQTLQHADKAADKATVQVYVWDSVTYEHLVRVIGRHLPELMANRQLAHLAWLFPPEVLVPNPDLSDRDCPVTIVREVIRAAVAAPVPHYYSLLSVAREYHDPQTPPPHNAFQVPAFFEDPLSDQIPSERAHDIWSRSGGKRPWLQQLQLLERTVRVKLNALWSVSRRVEEDLRDHLMQTAPRIADLGAPSLPAKMADDARLWFVFTQFNVALSRLKVQQILVMPTHEREARYQSALLTHRLDRRAAQVVLDRLELQPQQGRRVYALAKGSREVRAREGDFSFALSPADQPGFLERKLMKVIGQASVAIPRRLERQVWSPMSRVTGVSVAAVDREQGFIVLDIDGWWRPVVEGLERAGVVDFSKDVMMDPVHRDFLLKRLKATLNAIGNPLIAHSNAAVLSALNRKRKPQDGSDSPVAELLWQADGLQAAGVPRVLSPVQVLLKQAGCDLNASQWRAWQQALTHRLRLIWGPPGTGKSRTLRNIILGALHEAAQQGRSLRVLVTGPTYESIDNVLVEVHEHLSHGVLRLPDVATARLRSGTRAPSPRVPDVIDLPFDARDSTSQRLCRRLTRRNGLTLVGATAHQVHKLLCATGGPVSGVFDLIVVDEASQLDVAISTLALSGLAAGGAVVVAGDPKQLPPIHQAEPPTGLEHMVGSIYTYLEQRFSLKPCVLEVNYRSSDTIVRLAHAAEYPSTLHADSPDLAAHLLTPLPTTRPLDWPAWLYWTPNWSAMLDPAQTTTTFVYREGRSSQWNPFEAEAIAALTWLLYGRLEDGLHREQDPATGQHRPTSGRPYGLEGFWKKGVGIVTPHRAQQALVVAQLQRLFPAQAAPMIRSAVDTVERFQGQQRDVMLASFALGDPDAIRTEDEFLLSLNRFNVMASRARARLVVLVSREVVNHLSSDMVVLRDSALLKTFVDTFCSNGEPMELGHTSKGTTQTVSGTLRWR